MALSVPSGVEVESVEMLFSYGLAGEFTPESELTINNRLASSKFSYSADEGYYIVSIPNFSSRYNWSVRGMISYYDSNGALKKAYTNQINIVDKSEV